MKQQRTVYFHIWGADISHQISSIKWKPKWSETRRGFFHLTKRTCKKLSLSENISDNEKFKAILLQEQGSIEWWLHNFIYPGLLLSCWERFRNRRQNEDENSWAVLKQCCRDHQKIPRLLSMAIESPRWLTSAWHPLVLHSVAVSCQVSLENLVQSNKILNSMDKKTDLEIVAIITLIRSERNYESS